MMHIPGSCFPVNENFLEDIVELTKFRVERGQQGARKPVAGQARVLKSNEGVHVRGERDAKPKGQKYSDSTISTMEAIDEEKLNYKLMESLIAHIAASGKQGVSLHLSLAVSLAGSVSHSLSHSYTYYHLYLLL